MKKFICILILMFSLSHCTTTDMYTVLGLVLAETMEDNKDDN